MEWMDAVIGAYSLLDDLKVKPSSRKIIAVARACGAKFRDADAYAYLAKIKKRHNDMIIAALEEAKAVRDRKISAVVIRSSDELRKWAKEQAL